MKDVLDFELVLANMTLPREKRRNKTALYNPMTIAEVQQNYPEIPWLEHVNAILNNPDVTVEENEIVNVAVPKYVKEFLQLIPTVPDRVQANYILWRHAKFALSYLDSEALEIQLKFSKVLSGKARKRPRWEKCVKSTSGHDGMDFYYYEAEGGLSNAIGSMFVREYFDGPAKDIVDDIFKNIMREFRLMLDELDWMDGETRSRAHKKASLVTPHIAYDKEILDVKILNEFYEGLSLEPQGYLENILSLTKHINAYST